MFVAELNVDKQGLRHACVIWSGGGMSPWLQASKRRRHKNYLLLNAQSFNCLIKQSSILTGVHQIKTGARVDTVGGNDVHNGVIDLIACHNDDCRVIIMHSYLLLCESILK